MYRIPNECGALRDARAAQAELTLFSRRFPPSGETPSEHLLPRSGSLNTPKPRILVGKQLYEAISKEVWLRDLNTAQPAAKGTTVTRKSGPIQPCNLPA